MDLDLAPRRPAWPWVLAAVVVVVGGGVFVAQSQALARESEQSRVGPTAAAIAPTTPDGTPGSTPDGTPAPGSTPLAVPPPGRAAAQGRGIRLVAPDPTWTTTTSGRTGIPERALRAYAGAALTVQAEQPACGLGWNTLAGLGAIESAHGTHAGGVLRADGYPDPPIRGIALDGSASATIVDTDAGRFDGDAEWDRAVGPLQFIPATWSTWGADGNGDGAADPNQIDDAALAAGRYLCAAGEMVSAEGWRRAVFSYNHLDSYVDDVAAAANAFARLAG